MLISSKNSAHFSTRFNSVGQYIQFLDDDDRLLPTKISRQIPILENRGEVGVVRSVSGKRWRHKRTAIRNRHGFNVPCETVSNSVGVMIVVDSRSQLFHNRCYVRVGSDDEKDVQYQRLSRGNHWNVSCYLLGTLADECSDRIATECRSVTSRRNERA